MLRFSINNPCRLRLAALCLLGLLGAASCEKYKDEPGGTDPRLNRKYCNDPEAVNFNRDFPGTPDNSVCFYPADAYEGQYIFVDSIYSGAKVLQAQRTLTLTFTAEDKNKVIATGFCAGGGNGISFTANRQLRASADTTIVKGQALCRPKDTVSGYILQSLSDSTRLRFFLTVVSDTGVTLHEGTAYRQ